jgi:hypothetical protein
MNLSDWLRGGQPPASQAAHIMGIYAGGMASAPAQLPPDDQPSDCDITLTGCSVCPAPAVAVFLRLITFPHRQWAGWEAATVLERQACRHHADELLSAPDSPWHEVFTARTEAAPQ